MESVMLRTAQIHFIDEPIKLIHIPIESYGSYLQPVLQILYPLASPNAHANGDSPSSSPAPSSPWMNAHPFLNLSITPVECSLFCSAALAAKYFAPQLPANITSKPITSRLHSKNPSIPASGPTISKEDFVAISVEGEGLDAGQRVLELTTPLALAGISIFFITTYFSDYILVPSGARCKVVSALEARGFAFAHGRGSMPTPPSTSHSDHRRMSSISSLEGLPLRQFTSRPHSPTKPKPSTPTSLAELQARTIALLAKHNVHPTVHRNLRLHHCAASSPAADAAALQIGLMQCLAHPPSFLSLTLTGTEPASLLLEQETRKRFTTLNLNTRQVGGDGEGFSGGYGGYGGNGHSSNAGEGILMGSKDVLVPVTLDLAALGEGVTGVVCGVAGMLRGDEDDDDESIEMSYLSTARGAAVLVDEEAVGRAVERLRGLGGEE